MARGGAIWCGHWATVEDPQYDGHEMCLRCGGLLRRSTIEEDMARAVIAICEQSDAQPPDWAIEVVERVEDYYAD